VLARTQMMLYLTCELTVKGLNVLQYASKKGATKLLEEMLRTPYVFMNPVTEQFDVTYLIPDSVPEPVSAGQQKPLSCIELIVSNRNEQRAEDMLAVYPFCDLVRKYWVLCRRVYNAFLVVHVVFMTLFTIYAMPTTAFLASRFNLPPIHNSSKTDASPAFRRDTVPLYGLFLLWPVAVILLELLDIVEFCYRVCSEHRKENTHDDDAVGPEKPTKKLGLVRKWMALGQVLMFGFQYLSNISALAFSGSVIAWLMQTLLTSYIHILIRCLMGSFCTSVGVSLPILLSTTYLIYLNLNPNHTLLARRRCSIVICVLKLDSYEWQHRMLIEQEVFAALLTLTLTLLVSLLTY